MLLFFGQIRPGADPGWGQKDQKATATSRMHSNDLEACGNKCCYFWFHSEVKFLTRLWHLFSELQIIFESNAYLPPNFWLNADFQNLKLYCYPYIFSQCLKEKVLLFLSAYLLNIDLAVICYCLWYYIAKYCFCNTTYHNALTICR